MATASATAQSKDEFVSGVVDAINADQAPPAERRAALAAAVDRMAAGLAQWDAAVARVEAGLAKDIAGAPPPAAARMRLALGAVYLERGRDEAAIAQFQQAAALDASLPDPHAFRGLALERQGHAADAAAAYRQAWSRDRVNPVHAYRFLRASRGATGPDATNARAALLAAVDAPIAQPFLILTADVLEDGLATAPVMPLETTAPAFDLLRRGQYGQAVAAFKAALARPPSDRRAATPAIGAGAYFAVEGRQAHVRLDLDAAVAAYERRIALAPNDSAAHYDLADVYKARDDIDAALVEAAAAALLNLTSVRPIVMIGQLHAAAGRDADALRLFARAVGLAPDDAESRYGYSRALLRAGRAAEAQRELDVFRQLQQKALQQDRQRVEDNFRKIEETLQTTDPGGSRR